MSSLTSFYTKQTISTSPVLLDFLVAAFYILNPTSVVVDLLTRHHLLCHNWLITKYGNVGRTWLIAQQQPNLGWGHKLHLMPYWSCGGYFKQ